MKKLVLVVACIFFLVLVYSWGWNSGLFPLVLTPDPGSFGGPQKVESIEYGGVAKISTGTSVSVSIRRPYLFGLVELPVLMGKLDISWMHDVFFWSVFIILIVFIYLEYRNRGKHASHEKIDYNEEDDDFSAGEDFNVVETLGPVKKKLEVSL